MAHISDQFVSKYAAQQAPWGFGGLGEIVYLRTYSRRIEEIDRNEMWVDIAIEPVKAVEFIYIPLRIKNTGEIAGQAA